MTFYTERESIKEGFSEIKKRLRTVIMLPLAVFVAIYLSPDIAEYAMEGLILSGKIVVVSVFPYLILSDLFIAFCHPERLLFLSRGFERIFKINASAISAFILGAVCGFPIGVKVARELYVKGVISHNECERLIGFSNNTGPAFAISAIGITMRGNIYDGIIIYLAMIISALIVGWLFGIGKHASEGRNIDELESFSLSGSIRNAGLATLNISACIVFFSVIGGLFRKFIKSELLYLIIIPFLELTGAEAKISAFDFSLPHLSLALAAFALSFSGLSVHMQAKSILGGTDIGMKTYYAEKICQGLLSMPIAILLSLFIGR